MKRVQWAWGSHLRGPWRSTAVPGPASVYDRRRYRGWLTATQMHKPVGDCSSAPSANFVAMAPQHFARFNWIGHPRKPPSRPKHLRSICHTSRLIGDFVQILGSKFLALGGLNEKSPRTTFCRVPHGELTAKSGLIPSRNKKEKSIWRGMTDKQTSGQTEGQTDRVNCWQ